MGVLTRCGKNTDGWFFVGGDQSLYHALFVFGGEFSEVTLEPKNPLLTLGAWYTVVVTLMQPDDLMKPCSE